MYSPPICSPEDQIQAIERLLSEPQNTKDGYLTATPKEEFSKEALAYVHDLGYVALHAREGGTLFVKGY